MPSAISRPARLQRLVADLKQLKGEYEGWLGALPDALAESEMGERLEETITQLEEATDILEGVEPPKGFGRD